MKTYLIAIILLVACKPTQQKTLACKEFSPDCELQKDYQLVKLLEQPGRTVLDCYGLSLTVNRWYLRSAKALSLIPIDQVPGNGYSLADLENADIPNGFSKIRSRAETVKSFSFNLTCRTEIQGSMAQVKVKMLVLGPNYINFYLFSGRPSFIIRMSK